MVVVGGRFGSFMTTTGTDSVTCHQFDLNIHLRLVLKGTFSGDDLIEFIRLSELASGDKRRQVVLIFAILVCFHYCIGRFSA